jgi:hypothetical protein
MEKCRESDSQVYQETSAFQPTGSLGKGVWEWQLHVCMLAHTQTHTHTHIHRQVFIYVDEAWRVKSPGPGLRSPD